MELAEFQFSYAKGAFCDIEVIPDNAPCVWRVRFIYKYKKTTLQKMQIANNKNNYELIATSH